MKKRNVRPMPQDSLTHELYKNYELAGKTFGFYAHRFRESLRRNGGLVVAKRILNKKANGGLTQGFKAARDAGRLDLAVEAVALSPEFRDLFTPEELRIAADRLGGYGFTPQQVVKASVIYPDDLDDGPKYCEGAVMTVLVNRYERDPRARAACVRKHGARCKVCDVDFRERYGDLGDGFIHVHHVKPLGTVRQEYELDAEKDLVPVCPNCHAMLHKKKPPLFVHELQKFLRNK